MKKIIILLSLFIVSLSILSCKKDKKNNKPKTKKSSVAFSLKKANNEINFTAYKTTAKIPVGGQFKKVNIISGGEGNTIREAVNNTVFAIPVSSLFTKDASRDFKIRKHFFGVMDNTKLLSGKLLIDDNSTGYANIKMNGVMQKIPFSYKINDRVFSMKATIDVTNWNLIKALNSLNAICKDLHKGTDGISKTWSDVELNIKSVF